MSTLNVNNIDKESGSTLTIGGSGTTVNVSNMVPDVALSNRNLIQNGAMRVDQRNAGAAKTIATTANTYTLDRWNASGQVSDGVFTVQQVTESPAGFTNSTKITVTTADASIGSTEVYLFSQFIEGNNVGHLGFGTADAETITLSFWVRSSLTGTFGGALNNSANDRNYPFTYSISVADTWEKKTVTITGDTSGTWLTDTNRGIGLRFQLGAGSSRVDVAGAWTGTSLVFGATGATNLISTLNANLYITGVQLEVGEVATPFEHESYGDTLAKCQRYYQRFNASGNFSRYGNGYWSNSNDANVSISFPVPMRADPSIDDTGDVTDYGISNAGSVYTPTSLPTFYRGTQTSDGSCLVASLSLVSTGNGTAGNVAQFMSRGGGLAVGTFIGFDAEL